MVSGPATRLGGDRQRDGELRAVARLALNVNAAAVGLHDLARGGQPQAVATGPSRVEGAENLGQDLRRHADAGVDEAEENLPVAGFGLDGEFAALGHGLPGVEDRLPVLWTCGVGTGKITANQFVAYHSTNPAKIFGLYPRKGALLPGSDADIVIWDPEKKVMYGVALTHQRTDYDLYEGWELTGMPEKVFLRGKLIVDGDQWLGNTGEGQFLRRGEGVFL